MSLVIQNVSKNYGQKPALKNLSLTISPGVFSLIGPNGAGKTTLMEIVATILQPDCGRIVFRDVDLLSEPEKIRTQLGYLPQKFGYYPNLTVREFLDYILLFFKVNSPTERQKIIEQVLEKVGLSDVINDKLKTLSGGMIRRLGIAQSLLNNPGLLIVDEPTAGLDPEERLRFRQLLRQLVSQDEKRIVIISTHIINDVADLSGQIGIIKNGLLLFSGSPAEFIKLNQRFIWETTVDYSTGLELQKQYQVLNTSPGKGGVSYRIYAENPPAGAVPATPDLESAYFAFMGGKNQ